MVFDDRVRESSEGERVSTPAHRIHRGITRKESQKGKILRRLLIRTRNARQRYGGKKNSRLTNKIAKKRGDTSQKRKGAGMWENFILISRTNPSPASHNAHSFVGMKRTS